MLSDIKRICLIVVVLSWLFFILRLQKIVIYMQAVNEDLEESFVSQSMKRYKLIRAVIVVAGSLTTIDYGYLVPRTKKALPI